VKSVLEIKLSKREGANVTAFHRNSVALIKYSNILGRSISAKVKVFCSKIK
jgi:hypothetical protein